VSHSFLIYSMYITCAGHHNLQHSITTKERYYKISKFHGLTCFIRSENTAIEGHSLTECGTVEFVTYIPKICPNIETHMLI